MKKFYFSLLSLLVSTMLLAQQGTIAGKVIESESGFEVIGGNVVIQGTGTGSSTDVDGKYYFKVDPGVYTVECTYIGFETMVIADVTVKAGETTTLDIKMGESGIELEEVVVEARQMRNTEAAIMTIQKKSPVVLDGISSSQISKSGDNDVAGAIRRVTGVTVEDGKYVYVRGLGDRYSKTSLNGANIPGLDPNRNTVQMDLFPTELIDNILVYKTFSPDLPGDFTGGYVDIETKDFPDEKVIKASASIGMNLQTSFNKQFLQYEGGRRDWLGFDDGTRAMPTLLSNNGGAIPTANTDLKGLTDASKSFQNNWGFTNPDLPLLNHRFSLSVGDQKTLFGRPLGFIAGVTHQRSYLHYDDGVTGIYELSGQYDEANSLRALVKLDDSHSQEEVLWGAMGSLSYKLTPNHKISALFMRNQSGINNARYQAGKKMVDDPDDFFETRTLRYRQRALNTGQLSGKHVLPAWNNFEINWKSSIAQSMQDDPDMRFFTTRYREINSGSGYEFKPSSDRRPTRFYRDMNQVNIENKLDFVLPFVQWSGQRAKLKFGGNYLMKDRSFNEDRYTFQSDSNQYSGDITDHFAEENILSDSNPDGVYAVNSSIKANNYNAAYQSIGGYLMTELPITAKLRAIAGVRMQTTAVQFETLSEDKLLQYPELDGVTNLIENIDFLPSLNLNYEFNDKMKLRAAYSRTIALPTFRELAPVATFGTETGFIELGNTDLERTLIDNVDIRWELFPRSGEMITVGAFYKHFTNPIEKTYNREAPNGEYTWRNVGQADLLGAEMEFRKKLDFINSLKHFSFGVNFSYIYTKSDIDAEELANIRAARPDAEAHRSLYGQAPYTVNALLSYKNEKGTSCNASFNVIGSRISYITIGATPNIYEMPRPMLNFNFSQKIGDLLTAKFSANNILNARQREVIPFKGVDYVIQENSLGMNLSVGLSFMLR